MNYVQPISLNDMNVPVNALTDPLFGKRILHVASPARWNNDKYNVERCSNWKVLIDTLDITGLYPITKS